jgi:hypothetical protein
MDRRTVVSMPLVLATVYGRRVLAQEDRMAVSNCVSMVPSPRPREGPYGELMPESDCLRMVPME